MELAVDRGDKLARADRDIAEVERRVAGQVAFIQALAAKGLDTASATKLLRLMRCDLDAMRAHRRILSGEREGPPVHSRSRPGSRTRCPGRVPAPPRSDDRGREAPRPGAAAAGPMLMWESLPNRALIARAEEHLLVVRPIDGKKATFRFAVLKPLPENGGLLHVTAGTKRTAQEAMLAAERAVAPCPGPTAPLLPPPLPAPEAVGGDGGHVHPAPEALAVHLDSGMGVGETGTTRAL